MSVESPANLSILGLNPLSIEAGLYARFLGYNVILWGNQFCSELLQSPSSPIDPEHHISNLGTRALQAQDGSLNADVLLSAITDNQKLFDHYLKKLSQSDLLVETFQTNLKTIAVKMVDGPLPPTVDETIEYDTRAFQLSTLPGSLVENADVLVDMRTFKEVNELQIDYEFEVERKTGSTVTVQMNEWLETGTQTDSSDRLYTSVDDFYVMGETSLDTRLPFSFQLGLNQIRDLFKILCDRDELDLYQN
ncbi:MAG: hypothetical protein VX438_15355 [Planctomycetota bacterium]|nr:hypothetical protein [Planctomycetota bacterium]